MRILLDTHLALWAVVGSERISPQARALILAADEVFVSAASVWEIATRHALGKGDMPVSAAAALAAFTDAGYALLAVKPEHAVRVEALPPIHKDPFDRLLVAQAMVEPLTLLTHDAVLSQYSPSTILV